MKKILIFVLCSVAMMASCKNKSQEPKNDAVKGAESQESEAVKEAASKEMELMPMFIFSSLNNLLIPYWNEPDEPTTDDPNDEYYKRAHREWSIQNSMCQHPESYTQLYLAQGKKVEVKHIGEQLKDPDGGSASIGVMHEYYNTPMAGQTYAFANEKDAKEADDFGMGIVTTSEYAKSHKTLTIGGIEGDEEGGTVPFPTDVVAKLEKQYQMTALRSQMIYRIDNRYNYGVLQFKPKDGQVIALEVITDGQNVYSFPVKGYYESESSYGWNAEDAGEYFTSDIEMAFEGPYGVELCYTRSCPESFGIGMLILRDGKLERVQYGLFQTLIEESSQLWKKDLAQIRKLYLAYDPQGHKKYKLTKYRFIDIDGDNWQEAFVFDKDEKHGGLFSVADGKVELIAVFDGKLQPYFGSTEDRLHRYFLLKGSVGGPTMYTEVYEMDNSRVKHRFTALEVNGKMDQCTYDKKRMDIEQGKAYLQALPSLDKPYLYFEDIEE